jgi:hypothetical protein
VVAPDSTSLHPAGLVSRTELARHVVAPSVAP